MSKVYFWECLYDVDVAYMGPLSKSQRTHYDDDEIPAETMHVIRLQAAVAPDGMRRTKGHGDIIKTNKPLGKHLVQIISKKVSRPIVSLDGNRHTLKRTMRDKVGKALKFRLLDADEITAYVQEVAIAPGEVDMRSGKPKFGKGAHWREDMFRDAVEDVTLPEETQKFLSNIQAAVEGVEEVDLHAGDAV